MVPILSNRRYGILQYKHILYTLYSFLLMKRRMYIYVSLQMQLFGEQRSDHKSLHCVQHLTIFLDYNLFVHSFKKIDLSLLIYIRILNSFELMQSLLLNFNFTMFFKISFLRKTFLF